MKAPRGLSSEEAAIWARLAQSVTPLPGRVRPPVPSTGTVPTVVTAPGAAAPPARQGPPTRKAAAAPLPPPPPAPQAAHLDANWDRRLARGTVAPDVTLDLHGHTLDTAYDRLMGGMAQARAMGARVVLLIAGKPRGAAAADRGSQRGAIRAKVLDWLAASSHASAIAAIRKAHLRHGGEGALYIVLRKGA